MSVEQKAERIRSFDCVKAIGLAAVVVGHMSFLGFPKVVVDACYSFSMPLFFIVSGYFLQTQELNAGFVQKQARALLYPYLITALIVIIAMGVNALLLGLPVGKTMLDWSVAALYGSGGVFQGMPSGVISIGAIWFLLALFWSRILLLACRQLDHCAIWVLLLFVVGIETKNYLWLPFSIQPAFCATLFLFIGQEMRLGGLLKKGALPLPILFVIGFVSFYCAAYFGHLYMVSCTFEAGAIDVLGGIASFIVIYKTCEFLCNNFSRAANALSFIGRNSLPLFCMHLVELNAVPWALLIDRFQWSSPQLLIVSTAVHIILIALLSFLLYVSPRCISARFFPTRRCALNK